jgi:DNA-binding MarR family transcriptional regulator
MPDATCRMNDAEAEALLLRLVSHPETSFLAAMAEAFGVHAPQMPRHIDRLLDEGLIKRRGLPDFDITVLGERRLLETDDLGEWAARRLAERTRRRHEHRIFQERQRAKLHRPALPVVVEPPDVSALACEQFPEDEGLRKDFVREFERLAEQSSYLPLGRRLFLARQRTLAVGIPFDRRPYASGMRAEHPNDDEAEEMLLRRLIVAHNEGPMTPAQLRRLFGIHMDDVHHHLEGLMDKGLVKRVSRGRFAATRPGIDEIMEMEWPLPVRIEEPMPHHA